MSTVPCTHAHDTFSSHACGAVGGDSGDSGDSGNSGYSGSHLAFTRAARSPPPPKTHKPPHSPLAFTRAARLGVVL